jgi:hypothetical protein
VNAVDFALKMLFDFGIACGILGSLLFLYMALTR